MVSVVDATLLDCVLMSYRPCQRLNEMPAHHSTYTLGIAEDVGARRTMEDAYSFVVDYAGLQGQGFFAVFDGHAGKHAAEWCGAHFHEVSIASRRCQSAYSLRA